jgi:hypothetical protein
MPGNGLIFYNNIWSRGHYKKAKTIKIVKSGIHGMSFALLFTFGDLR